MKRSPRFKDETGNTFGDWTVIEFSHMKNGRAYWLCECECGEKRPVIGKDLRSGKSKSCGKTHGMSQTTEYNTWHGMKLRCETPTSPDYDRYGGRGIYVCERWSESFKAFYEDMGNRPTPNHQLERIDNDGPYSPENCVWATPRQQGNNKRNNIVITIDGVTKTLPQWAREKGIRPHTVRGRIYRGWSKYDAVMKPLQ